MADTAVKEAAKSDAVEPCLRFFRTALIQLHAVGIAVISLSQLAQSLTAAAAWIKEVRGDTIREPDTSQHQRDVVRIGRVIAQLDVVHQAAYHGGIGLLSRGERSREPAQHLIDWLVACTHEIEAAHSPAKLSCHRCQFVLFHFQQK